MPIEVTPLERPLLPLACALGAGIALGYGWPARGAWAALGSAGCLMWIGMGIRHRRPALIAPLVLFCSLGYLLIQHWAAPRFPPHDIIHYAGKGTCLIVGRIDSAPVTSAYRQKFILSALLVIRHHHRYKSEGKLRVTFADDTFPLSEGSLVRLRGSIRLLHNFNNPGGFDYKRYMAARGVWASVYVPKNALKVLEGRRGRSGPLARGRSRIAVFLEKTVGGQALGVFKTLLLGDRRGLAPETREAFQRAGIGHLLAISGLHVGIVGGVLFFLATGVLGRVPGLLWRGWVRRAAALVAVMGIWAYGILAGMPPSTQRAVLMMTLFFSSLFSGRSHDLLNALAGAALGILVFHPPAVAETSFQLSFAAVAAIILGLGITGGEATVAGRGFWGAWRRRVSTFGLVSLYATLGTLPLVMGCFHQISLVGLPANFIFVPLIGFCVLPLGLGAVCLLPASPFLASVLLWPADRLLRGCLILVQKMAAWPFSSMMTIIPTGFEIVCYYTVALLMVIYLRGRHGGRARGGLDPAATGRRFWRWTAVSCLLIVLVDAGYWGWQRFWRRDLRVTVVDVGNGTANILELPGGKTLLIDGGGFFDNAVFDVGKNILAPILLRKKILGIEEILLSHADSDHLNGLVYIVGHFRVERLRYHGEPADTKSYHELMRIVRERHIGTAHTPGVTGSEWLNGVCLKFLYPPVDYRHRGKGAVWRQNPNNHSLVVQVCYGEHRFLFPGDIEAGAEQELVNTLGENLRSDVLMAPHHGSPTSGTRAFLVAVAPRTVVFSTGLIRGRARPARKVRARYAAVCERMYTTATNGAVIFCTDGHCLSQRATIADPMPVGF